MTDDEISEILLPLMPLKDPYVFARAIAAAEREAIIARLIELGALDDGTYLEAIRMRSNAQ